MSEAVGMVWFHGYGPKAELSHPSLLLFSNPSLESCLTSFVVVAHREGMDPEFSLFS